MWFMVIMGLTKSNRLCSNVCSCLDELCVFIFVFYLNRIVLSLFSLADCVYDSHANAINSNRDLLKTVFIQCANQGVHSASMGSLFQIKSFWCIIYIAVSQLCASFDSSCA